MVYNLASRKVGCSARFVCSSELSVPRNQGKFSKASDVLGENDARRHGSARVCAE
jgi:hypothetical protein